LSVIVITALSTPPAVGAKWPWIVQFAPTARLVPHELANTNEVAFVPVTAMLAIVKATVPVFVIVTNCDPLAEPTAVAAKARFVNDRVTGGVEPVPLNVTLCGDPVALSATFSAAVSAPVVVGFNSTEIVQLAPIASVAPHVLADFMNELASVPEKLVDPTVTTAALVFFNVTS